MSAEIESDHEQKRHKKSKRKHRQEDKADMAGIDETPKATDSTKKEKKHKSKKRKERTEDRGGDSADAEPAASPEKKKHKRHKSEDSKEKKHKKHHKHDKHASSPEKPAAPIETRKGAVPDEKEYPFYTQTFSQRIPVWPTAMDEPLTKITREYLDPMLNRYSPKIRGVLLSYKNVNLSGRPQRADPANPPTDDTPVVFESVDSYAPPFGWLTADLHIFVPSRGAWMEGVINLQSEGHIGVVCFEKFNASISRRSLPRGWKWVDQSLGEYESAAAEEDPFTEDDNDAADGQGEEGGGKSSDAHQVRSSGYWADENGDEVSGKVYFRIKNFSSGSTGDYTYLSLQGTMLDDEAEKEAAAEEREMEKARRARQNPSGLLYPTMTLPEYSMTKLMDDSI